jgi:microcystin-dependent protein
MGTSSSPEFPYPGGTAGAEAPDPQVGKPGHFAWSRWIKQFVKNLDAETVKRSGDVMTGLLTLAGNPTAPGHAATKAYVDSSQRPAPIGTIVMYGGTTAPPDWHLCDGSTHGSAALQAITGSARTPDLRGRFVVAANSAGGDAPSMSGRSSYTQNEVGGADQVTLTADQSGLRAHAHTVDPPNAGTGAMLGNQSHSHGAWTGGMKQNAVHSHAAGWMEGTPNANDDGQVIDSTGPSQGYVRWDIHVQNTDVNHTHDVGMNAANVDHSHHVDIPAFSSHNQGPWNAAAGHENRPPYYALTYIIKKA